MEELDDNGLIIVSMVQKVQSLQCSCFFACDICIHYQFNTFASLIYWYVHFACLCMNIYMYMFTYTYIQLHICVYVPVCTDEE